MTERRNAFENPALLIVDMQNDFVRQDAPLQVPDALGTIAAHQALIAAFRKHRRPVIYTKYLATQITSLGWIWTPECEPHTKCCWQGYFRHYPDLDRELDCTEVIDELRPEADDLIVEKYGYGAFHGTSLNDSLRDIGVKSLAITGTVTQICVEETARQAFHHRFPTTVVADAVSSFDPELHAATLRNFTMKFGWVQTSTEVIAALG
jgi:nicotinamidase-related amidase